MRHLRLTAAIMALSGCVVQAQPGRGEIEATTKVFVRNIWLKKLN